MPYFSIGNTSTHSFMVDLPAIAAVSFRFSEGGLVALVFLLQKVAFFVLKKSIKTDSTDFIRLLEKKHRN